MPVIVLWHAFPQTGVMWQGVADRLGPAFQAYTPTLPGFGAAPPHDWTVDAVADELAESLRKAGHDRAVVGGCSMGGYVALAFARRHPDRLAGLVLANTRADADSPEALAGRAATLKLVAEQGTATLVEKVLPRLLGASTRRDRPELVERVRTLGCAQSAEAIRAAVVAMRDRPDSTADLPAIAAPTLVLVGAEDEFAPPEVGAAMARAIPNAELVTLPACGHLSPWEAPDAVADAILARFTG